MKQQPKQRDGIVRLGPDKWAVVLDGYVIDPVTGRKRRHRRWVGVTGTRHAAVIVRDEHRDKQHKGTFVEPSKATLAEWLREWLASLGTSVAPSTLDRYTGIVNASLIPQLGAHSLQGLKPFHLERYYSDLAAAGLAPGTIDLHHVVLYSALKKAERNDLIARNPAARVQHRPKQHEDADDAHVAENVWDAEQAARFLDAAVAAGVQQAAFYTLALDSGARRGELAGLKWEDLDVAAGTVTIRRKLLKGGVTPLFGTPKRRKLRTLPLTPISLERLAAHKSAQAEVKMANRRHYHDHGLVFAKADAGSAHLGEPLSVNNLGQREFAALITAARVPRITLHWLRHTCATLMLQAGEPVNVVQKHLGHAKVEITLNVYAHVLRAMETGAVARRATWLHAAANA